MSQENRIHPRQILEGTVSLFQHESKEYIGLLVDFSESGIMLSSYTPLDVGVVMDIDLVDIPPNIDSRRSGKIKAEVVWNDRISHSMYGNGCRLIESSDSAKQMLNSYLK